MDISENGRCVLCGASNYEEKFYFNPVFARIPEAVKKELKIICVLFTQEAGGIIQMLFDEDGELVLETSAAEEDILYDEIGAGLLVNEIRRSRRELFESLSLYYRTFHGQEQ